MCFGCSKEPSHRDSSFEYPQHVLVEKYKKKSVTHSYLGACVIVRENLKIDKLEKLLKARTCHSSEYFIIVPRREKTGLRGFRPGPT